METLYNISTKAPFMKELSLMGIVKVRVSFFHKRTISMRVISREGLGMDTADVFISRLRKSTKDFSRRTKKMA